MSEYADWLEKWATTEGMGIEPDEPDDFDGTQSDIGGEPCEGNGERLLAESPSTIWSPDQWQYWCRGKRTATELLRIWEVLP